MRPGDREVHGMTCAEVMADLSAYVDRDLPADRARRLEAHVSACQLCAAFGAGFAALIEQVRERLREPDAVPADVASRLDAALDARDDSA